MSGAVSKKDFAAIYGCSKAYVSQLVAARRLVLTADGKAVQVDASLELLGATADPSKAGVRERWAAFRQAQAGATSAAATPTPPTVTAHAAQAPVVAVADPVQQPLIDDQPAPTTADQKTASPARSDYQDARTRREQAEAELAQIELMKARGKVLDADSTLRAVATAHITVCTELMNFSDRLTPLVLGQTDKRKVWQLIHAECERLAGRVQQAAQQLAQQAKAEVAA